MSHKQDEKLGFIEAERINAILEDTTEKLGFLDRFSYILIHHKILYTKLTYYYF